MKPKGVTTQTKALDKNISTVLFLLLLKKLIFFIKRLLNIETKNGSGRVKVKTCHVPSVASNALGRSSQCHAPYGCSPPLRPAVRRKPITWRFPRAQIYHLLKRPCGVGGSKDVGWTVV